MQPDMDPIEPAVIDWTDGTPSAPAFRDHYYSTAGGAEESRQVFLDGARLDARFDALADRDVFVIGETGFGTGLNLLLAADRFLARAADGARLHLVSAEKHPLRPADLRRALDAWPELAAWSVRLLEQWPAPTPGFHRLDLHERIDLTLMFGDAEAMWQAQDAAVDAWFLDGFAPSRNASMWTPALFRRLAELSRPGATLATFSAAGAVRRGLAEVGFEVRRAEGFGGKRHRLEACWPGEWRARAAHRGHALIVGAGLAGSTAAHALARRGWTCRVFDAHGVAAGASGNRAGVVYTTPSGAATPQNRFYQSSWLRALGWLARADAVGRGLGRFDGVEQMATDTRHAQKLERALASGHWPPELLEAIDEDCVLLKPGGVLRPADWCRFLLDHPAITLDHDCVLSVDAEQARVRLRRGGTAQGDAVVICAAGATNALLAGPPLPLRTLRGQVTDVAATAASRRWTRAVCHAGYFTPELDDAHCIGATFDLHRDDDEPCDGDDRANLAGLKHWRPDAWAELGGAAVSVVGRRVGFRCTSRDYLPVVGPLDPACRSWVCAAFGSRGISGTPLAAERIADALSGAPSGLDAALRRALDPARFETPGAAGRTGSDGGRRTGGR
ncbi:bifunctional tRNA (5-methylaminomethyl-2-thiouridine)(34)-methyltransferase MnmD/FAD-dependent 5-carboxymethylaminomethyl-2-thiouridine(34) oxidoreductase MnmC [Wenzhouxiangella sp. XN79A]|uniref:bifunctional tRNA (5-methylaminomethyl-2-thiouridine)(34)-methyltransferase MnmD/FAD-dependent 5-carboxymethylaminomethyl-2-thiouridine(34) oxidoreductase MnmC n=1 Tax=Wenzhouxiangella sp. XN79A TaxID=2724193 RepID=UPI00144A852A|nr:bifunctional tRNA (5-methylaminomethyl-2-thiouridine)(34)-methyltransferase MnmD/FAD-dependent 5-carboxymethylaminomethyl-2-thiouridine(34) oxidoreductase MnmC [Wenzhouxiangella sp. XN79A]NKI35436.1 bifunctional tRNA (5-methylaminomethyl-2-thiouridine)(34)-methyltransferase MnmD/FAD-dependent 5-carboxymethylaminomethyl-2-thiouridine(34) oxidoreductase MnmC [Wenzhouxiangella sp. XN79A]